MVKNSALAGTQEEEARIVSVVSGIARQGIYLIFIKINKDLLNINIVSMTDQIKVQMKATYIFCEVLV